jgi:HEAT repeat protein
VAFEGSPMKRAKLRGLQRNAAVVLGDVGTADDVDVLTRALACDEPLVREHAQWALGRIAARQDTSVSRATTVSRNADVHADAHADSRR